MSSRRIAAALLAGTVVSFMAAGSAFACKGTTTLLRDDFTDEDPAWNIQDNGAQIGGGVLKITSDPGKNYWLIYGGDNYPTADACVEMIAPSGGKPDPDIFAGLAFWGGGKWNIVEIATDGTAGVYGTNNSGWTTPVPQRKFDGIKTGPGASNTIRITWKGPPPSNSKEAPDPNVTVYINDKQFIKFKVTPNADRNIGIYVQSEGGTYQFKNLNVTQ
jgi:hypothetical protein